MVRRNIKLFLYVTSALYTINIHVIRRIIGAHTPIRSFTCGMVDTSQNGLKPLSVTFIKCTVFFRYFTNLFHADIKTLLFNIFAVVNTTLLSVIIISLRVDIEVLYAYSRM